MTQGVSQQRRAIMRIIQLSFCGEYKITPIKFSLRKGIVIVKNYFYQIYMRSHQVVWKQSAHEMSHEGWERNSSTVKYNYSLSLTFPFYGAMKNGGLVMSVNKMEYVRGEEIWCLCRPCDQPPVLMKIKSEPPDKETGTLSKSSHSLCYIRTS